MPYLEQKGHLINCKPKDFSYKDGWLPLYTRAGITKHLSDLESLLNKDKTSPLIVVILPEMDFQYEREYVIHKLHKSESLNRICISYDTNQRKQIAFCPYCGVMNENTATAFSHVRKHLGIAFLCGGCYDKIYKKPQFCITTCCLAGQPSSTGRRRILRRVKARANEAYLQSPDKDLTESSQDGPQPLPRRSFSISYHTEA